MAATALISFFLPAFLVHRLSTPVYGAWVLILNLGAYVGYLDFGVQTAVSKFVAEHDARKDAEGCGRCASTGLVMMLGATVLGLALTCGLAWSVPTLFRKMPAGLYHDVRLSIVLVGASLSIGLAASVFPAIFLGLQRYRVPTVINVIGRALYAAVLCLAVMRHSSLAVMGMAVAGVNVLTALLHVVAWRTLARHVQLRLFPVDRKTLGKMMQYCIVLTLWSMSMLLISGVDMTIVGHYAFAQVPYYSIATAPTNFMLVLMGALLGPLLPATSALSIERNPEQMGAVLLRATRYATLALALSGLPLLVGGYFILKVWVGAAYAARAVQLLRVLVAANILRQLCAPYSTMVVATGQQRFASVSAIAEGLVNLGSSLWLASRYGAIGVAAGTLIGAASGVATHFAVSMHYTRNLRVSRWRLFAQGILRPASTAVPSLLLWRYWFHAGAPAMGWLLWVGWGAATLAIAVLLGITVADRSAFSRGLSKRLRSPMLKAV